MTTKHTPAAKTATTRAESGTERDPKHPDSVPEREAGNGMQELTTTPAAADAKGAPDGVGAGTHQAALAPNPSIGVTYDGGVENAGTAVLDEDAIADGDYVFSHEHALSLPVLEEGQKGTPVKAPKAGSKAEKDLDGKVPVLAFVDADRRTMQVVKTKDGLAAQAVD